MESLSRCKRCNRPFKPKFLEGLNKMSSCCETCMCRNLFDGLGLPTPPELLDKHTNRPTLTEEEFRKELHKAKDEPIPDNE